VYYARVIKSKKEQLVGKKIRLIPGLFKTKKLSKEESMKFVACLL
jgi:hypothetical protein